MVLIICGCFKGVVNGNAEDNEFEQNIDQNEDTEDNKTQQNVQFDKQTIDEKEENVVEDFIKEVCVRVR